MTPAPLSGAGSGRDEHVGGEGMMTSAVSGSWRMMSMVTKCDYFLLRMTRASRA